MARSLELFFIDDTPDGMLTAELSNWTGHLLMTPRTRLAAALQRPEAQHTGVYVLLDAIEETRKIYIGEGENTAQRIKDHDARKSWWEYAVLISSRGNSLHKAHVKYLEARLVGIASSIAAVELENRNIPPLGSLSEATQSNMETFLENIRLILPALGIRAFQEGVRKVNIIRMARAVDVPEPDTPKFLLHNLKRGVEARAVLRGADFVISRGSFAQATWNGADRHAYQRLHETLMKRGVLKPVGNDLAKFTEDYAFKSPSAAAAVVNGRQANGRLEWKHLESGATFSDWENQRLSLN